MSMLREDEVVFCLTKEAIVDGTEVLLGNGETVRFANCEGYLSNLRSGFATLVGERFTSLGSLGHTTLSQRYQQNRGEEILPHNFAGRRTEGGTQYIRNYLAAFFVVVLKPIK